MKKLYFLLVTLLVTSLSFGQNLIITGAFDGPLPGGTPKLVEIYVVNDIADLSTYGFGSANNGGGTDGQEIAFTGSATAGDFIYVAFEGSGGSANPGSVNAYFGITPDYLDFAAGINGDDALEVFNNAIVIDTFGDINVDGNGTPWEYLDGWAYRVDGTGPEGATFTVANWTYSGPNAVDNCTDNASCASVFPIGTYSPMMNTNPTVTITSPSDFQVLPSGTSTVDVFFTTANAPGATVDITLITNGGAPVVTTNAASPFQIVGAVDGDAFEVTAELVDGTVLDFETINFSIAFPCDLQVGTITETCDAINPGPGDTYNVTIDYTGGATTTYTIDTGGVGTLGGDNPDSVAAGTITVTGIAEGTDFIITFTGNPTNSSCDITRNINSPDCDPQLMLPLTETFTYPDGSLVGNSEWTSHSGTAGDLQVVSGQVLVQHGSPSEDANLPFASVTGDLFYAFNMTVQDPGGPIAGTDNEYFAHFKDSGFGFTAQLFVVPPTGAGDYTVGISSDVNSPDATWATDLSYGTSYRVTVRYDQDTNIAELWVDAALETDTSILGADEADPGDTIASFAFRQSDSDLNEGILVDNLRITETFAETLSTEEFSAADTFKVYPNPTSTGFVNIISANNDNITVTVFDILGKQVINETLTNDRLNVSALNTGIYILKISQNNATVTKKLVIK